MTKLEAMRIESDKLPQSVLAHKTGVDQKYISHWERHQIPMSDSGFGRIAAYFKMPVSELFPERGGIK